MNVVKVLNNQNLFNIAIQEYGTVEAVFELAMAKNLSITDELTTGEKLVIPETSPITGLAIVKNIEVLSYYKKNEIKPATAMPIEPATMQLKYGDINMISNYFE